MHRRYPHPLRRAVGIFVLLIIAVISLNLIRLLTEFGTILFALIIGYYAGKARTLRAVQTGIAKLIANSAYGPGDEKPTVTAEVIETDAVSPYPPEFTGGNRD